MELFTFKKAGNHHINHTITTSSQFEFSWVH